MGIAEGARLPGADGRGVSRVEEDNDGSLGPERVQTPSPSRGVPEGKSRRDVARRNHASRMLGGAPRCVEKALGPWRRTCRGKASVTVQLGAGVELSAPAEAGPRPRLASFELTAGLHAVPH